MAPADIKRHFKRHFLSWAVFLFVVALAAAFFAGFRPGPGLTLVRVGTLVVTDIPAGTSLFVDQAFRGTSDGGDLSADLVPGTHSVIVDAPDQQPWNTALTITASTDTVVSPILVPEAPTRAQLLNAEATTAANALAAMKLPTEFAPLTVGCTNISVSGNRVIASVASTTPACETPEFLCSEGVCSPTIIYTPVTPIRSVITFPGRTDSLLVATGEWVYAIDIDPRSPQFFAPVGHGEAPVIAPQSDQAFYLKDKDKFYSFEI